MNKFKIPRDRDWTDKERNIMRKMSLNFKNCKFKIGDVITSMRRYSIVFKVTKEWLDFHKDKDYVCYKKANKKEIEISNLIYQTKIKYDENEIKELNKLKKELRKNINFYKTQIIN